MRMRFLLVACAALMLAGCQNGFQLPSVNVGGTVTLNTVQGVEGAYGVALSGERTYKSFPLCRTGTSFSATNICARRSVVVRLQSLDRKAISAIDAMVSFVKNYPTVDATNVIAAAGAAVKDIQNVLAENGVPTSGNN